MKKFKIQASTYQGMKQIYQRSGLSDTPVNYYVDKGIWYCFEKISNGIAIYQECPDNKVPAYILKGARMLYPGALNP